jgi:lysophospholipase L1-like esterase
MKTACIASLLLILLTLGLPLKAQAPAATTLKIADGDSIAFLGDSITQFGWDQPGGYVRQVIAGFKSIGLKIKPFPAGISGQTSAQMLARIQKDVIDKKPTWMTLSCGVNDVWHNAVSLDDYKKNVTAMVDQAQAAGIKVMLLTPTPIMEVDNDFNKKLADYNDFLRQFAQAKNIPLVDVNTAFWTKLKAAPPAPGTTLLTVDGVHPNPEGNFVFASNILAAFGVTPAQVSQYETQWRSSDDAAGVPAGVLTANGIEISSALNDNLVAAAKARGMGTMYFNIELVYQAFYAVLKTHAQDPDYAAGLSSSSINPEVSKVLLQLIEALPPASPGTTPASAPTSAASATPPAKVRLNASVFMTDNAAVSLTTYNKVLAEAQARKMSLNTFGNAVFFQAVRDTVKTHPGQEKMTFDQAINQFVPDAKLAYGKLLNAQPPAWVNMPPPVVPAAGIPGPANK